MELKSLYIQNFMSVGEDPLILNFQDYSGITLIKGLNLDISSTASNGAGKSLISAAICFAYFEKTINGLSKDKCINNIIGKKLKIEHEVNNLKIIRTRKPNSLKLFENDQEITLSSMALTQQLLEQKIGLNYETFINIFYFGQNNYYSFLNADKKTRRAIIENLLSLEEYNEYEENAKTKQKELKILISSFTDQYGKLKNNLQLKQTRLNEFDNKLKQLQNNILNEMQELEKKIKEIEKVDIKSNLEHWELYEQAKLKFEEINNKIHELNKEIHSKKENISPIMYKLSEINENLKKIKKSDDKTGSICKYCLCEITKENLEKTKPIFLKEKEEILEKIQPLTLEIEELDKIYEKLSNKLKDVQKLIKNKPQIEKEKLISFEIQKNHYEENLNKKKNELHINPYKEMIESIKEEINNLENEIKSIDQKINENEILLPYIKFWVSAFGESGIRTFIISKIIDLLNKRINYWLKFLYNNEINICFDNCLDVNIKRKNNEEFYYEQSCGGEKQRIDMAIAFAFAHIMRLSANAQNNIIFLDEVAESLDYDGIDGVYKSMQELSKDKKVFVITHNPYLLEKLEHCSTLNIIKQNNFSKIKSN